MLQIENEYGSFGNDRNYLLRLRQVWRDAGIRVPFYAAADARAC
jgi:beta-galactosidase